MRVSQICLRVDQICLRVSEICLRVNQICLRVSKICLRVNPISLQVSQICSQFSQTCLRARQMLTELKCCGRFRFVTRGEAFARLADRLLRESTKLKSQPPNQPAGGDR